jgi:hypothetical protein
VILIIVLLGVVMFIGLLGGVVMLVIISTTLFVANYLAAAKLVK